MIHGDEMPIMSVGRAALLAVYAGCVPLSVDAAEEVAQNSTVPSQTSTTEPGTTDPELDVKKLFAAQCAWCHADYGLKAGKAPQLAGTRLTEKQVYNTIRNGRADAMPSFRRTLTEEQIQVFVKYIKSLQAPQ